MNEYIRPWGSVVLESTAGEKMGSGVSVGACFLAQGMLIQLHLKQFSSSWHITVEVGVLL